MAYAIHSDVSQDLKDRFMSRVYPCPTSGCWLWGGSWYNTGYGEVWVNSRKALAHRLAYAIFVGDVLGENIIDHKCCNKHCVNPEHLRLCDKSQNGANRGLNKNNKSGFKGVSFSKRNGKWVATISPDGKSKFLGYFDTPEEAYERRKQEDAKVFGEFAYVGGV